MEIGNAGLPFCPTGAGGALVRRDASSSGSSGHKPAGQETGVPGSGIPIIIPNVTFSVFPCRQTSF
jgi:hypothetical protein